MEDKLLGVDTELGLYELTDLFYSYYLYHNSNVRYDYDEYLAYDPKRQGFSSQKSSLSRFQSLRRIEAARLGSRPYLAGRGISPNIPNISLGYLSWIFKYLVLPYKSMLTESDIVRFQIDKKLFDDEQLSDKEKEEMRLNAANNPNLVNNKEISDDVSDAYSKVLKTSNAYRKCAEVIPLRLVQDGLVSILHSDVDWRPEPIPAIDLVTEPQAEWDPSKWNCFFVIKKITAAEVVRHIREKTSFWNPDALRWALESANTGRGLLTGSHYNRIYDDKDEPTCGENYMVKSFFQEKSNRVTNISSYYGNMLVVEAYYINTKGKVNKAILFPSSDYYNIGPAERKARADYFSGDSKKGSPMEELRGADILFFRESVFDTMKEAITVVPFAREELSLERQRGYGHELFSLAEMAMRMDSSILNFAILMGVPFTKNRAQGVNAQDLEDIEIGIDGGTVDLGDRDFVETPFSADLQSMLAVRSVILQHMAAKAYLGGLDNTESMTNSGGFGLANMRLVRDSRVHKNVVEDFASGLREMLTKIFRRILDLKDRSLLDDPLLKKCFFDYIINVQGHSEEIFEFKNSDIVEDTLLPYWMNIETIRNGAAHFGAAEVVLYSQLKQIFGDGLDQKALQALNRMAIKSMLSSQDALDILGDPKDSVVTAQDQMYRAMLENASILGGVDSGALSYEPVPILTDKDDHVAHLTQVHLPKMQQLLQAIAENEVSPAELEAMPENDIETRTSTILRVGALANHASQHLDMLSRFGSKRDDINRLKEEANNVLQGAERMLNNLQMYLRALQAKRQEKEMKLRGMAPENEAERMKVELELAKLQAQTVRDGNSLALANKIADQKQQQHIDKQVSKARDRNTKIQTDEANRQLKREENYLKAQTESMKIRAQQAQPAKQ